jgi:ABC-type nitrate/sulfonate/bicarbonate transport system substrate-binding protein
MSLQNVTFARYPGDTARIMFAPISIATDRGYFSEAGIEVALTAPPDHPWAAVASGAADFGVGFVDYCAAPAFHGRIKLAAVHEQFRDGHGLATLLARRNLVESGALQDCADLRGKRLGLLGARGDDYLTFYGALAQGGLTIDDVEAVAVPHVGTERRHALEAGAIDVVIGRRPRNIEDEVADGLVVRWKVGDEVYPNFQARYIVCSETFAQNRPDAAVAFLGAYRRGVRDYLAAFDDGVRREEMLDYLVDTTGEHRMLLSSMKPAGFSLELVIDMDLLDRDVELLRQRALMPADVSLESLVDSRFAEAAVAQQ